MAVIINGDTGIDKITDGSVTTADLASTLDLSGKTMTYGNLPAANLTGSLPAVDGSNLTGIETGQVLEYITGVCDGTTVTTPYNTYTLTNVSGAQTLTGSYAVVNGSSIAYTPPSGTKKVLYRFSFMHRWINQHAITHLRFYIDSNEVTLARMSTAAQLAEQLVNFEWVMDIGNSTNSTTGRFTSWTADKTLQLRARYYGGSNNGELHRSRYWDGLDSPQLHKPTLTIIALG